MHNRINFGKMLGLVALTGAMAFAVRPASAQYIIDGGNFGGGSGGNVLVGGSITTTTIPSHIDGNLNGAPASLDGIVNVDSSTDKLTGTGGGQATFDSVDGLVNEICFSLKNMSGQYYFGRFSLDPEAQSGPNAVNGPFNVEITYVDSLGNLTTVTENNVGDLSDNGNHRFGVTATAGYLLKEVCFISEAGAKDVKQARILDYTQTLPPTGGQVPEPGTYAMCAGLAVPIFGLVRRNRMK